MKFYGLTVIISERGNAPRGHAVRERGNAPRGHAVRERGNAPRGHAVRGNAPRGNVTHPKPSRVSGGFMVVSRSKSII